MAGWLLFGSLDIPGYGTGVLWALVFILFAISGVELAVYMGGRLPFRIHGFMRYSGAVTRVGRSRRATRG